MLQAVDRCGAIPATARPAPFPRGPFRVGLLALAAAMALAGCNDDGSAAKSASAPAQPVTAIPAPADTPQPAVVQAAYTPPAADVLYQMVAPIALYPDKLVAQILAGSTYPDQVSAAEMWLAQNPGLKGAALSNGANAQPWDPSIKSLTQFPNVLGQMASNLPWTTALGKAYYNDPADVMNAIQVMRSRAYKAGSLKSSNQLKVKRLADAPPAENYIPADFVPAMPLSAPVIAPPPEFIEIAPAEPAMVYVPQYDPTVVYGDPMPVYGGYSYIAAPPPVMVGSVVTPVVAGLIGFGVGITVTEVVDHRRPWGWDSWRMHWGEPGRPGYWREGQRPPPPLARPAVVYNHQTYISQSTTVVENVRVNNNASRFGAARPAPEMTAPPGPGPALAAGAIAAGAAAASGYALTQRHPPQPPQGAAPFPGREPPNQQPPRGLTMAQQLGRPQPPAQPGDQARRESPEQQRAQQQATLNAQQQTMERQRAQQFMQRPPQDQAQQQRMQEQQVRQQQAAQQRAQEQQARQQQEAQQQAQQRALQRTQQDQAHQQQLAQQRAQEQQTRQQQAAQQQAQQQATQRTQQDQAHQQQLAQQRAQEQQARQQQAAQQQAMQRAQQEQAHQQQQAQQRAQEQQARQQQAAQQQAMQRAQQEQAHQQQMAQQRAQEQQMRQQQAAQQRAQQEQMHQQQMAQQRAQEQQMRQQQAAQQHAQQQAMQRAQQQQMFHQAREGRRGDRPER
ncbi:MAG: DUF3300 domain-containing protein [Comamonas sp.]